MPRREVELDGEGKMRCEMMLEFMAEDHWSGNFSKQTSNISSASGVWITKNNDIPYSVAGK